MNILLIGPFPPKIGGDSRHMKDTAEYFERNGVNYTAFNISRSGNYNFLAESCLLYFRYLFFLIKTYRSNNQVILNCNEGGIVTLGFPLLIIYKKRNLKLRVFGGGILNYYFEISNFKKKILLRIISSFPKIYIQTLQSISGLQGLLPNNQFIHLPASIHLPDFCKLVSYNLEKKFKIIYSGHLWRSKGIDLILEFSKIKPENIEIDLYGSLDEYDLEYLSRFNVNYRGIYKHDQCYNVLVNYDLLILPTSARCEGYPGVILESMAVGVPVLVSNWNAISEVVTSDRGLIMDNISAQNLLEEILKLQSDRLFYNKIVNNAHSFIRQFEFNSIVQILLK
jgi:glycosyltransferase involved in cell wall biosynthesis